MRICLLLLVFFNLLKPQLLSAASYTIDYNERCEKASKEFLSLRIDEGASLIRQELTAQPHNLMAVYVSDYQDVLPLLFNGDRSQLLARKKFMDERLAMIEKGGSKSPWYLTFKAGIHLHWALVYMRMGENYKAAVYFRKAYLYAKENQSKYPTFSYNKYFIGIGEAVIGTLPDEYKWIASLFGMKGNVNQGLAKLTSFINSSTNDDFFRSEAVIFHCYLKFYLQSRQDEVWRFLNSNQFSITNNPMHAFVKANIALNYRKADIAILTLQSVQQTKAFSQFPAFDYELGSAYMLKLDDRASTYFLRFLQKDEGGFFVKDAYMQLALINYMQGKMLQANSYRQAIKNHGGLSTDADKQAQRFASHMDWVAIPVLKSRFLIDGGFYQEALEILSNTKVQTLTKPSDKLEYYFRIARAYDELNNDLKAKEYYQITIQQGRSRKEHFAARAALQMGFMYERANKTAEAITMYNDCLSMKNHDFQANIDQQAKAGLNRLHQ